MMDPMPHMMKVENFDSYVDEASHWRRLYRAEAREHDALKRDARDVARATLWMVALIGVCCGSIGFILGQVL